MVWIKRINGSDPGDATHVGTDQWDLNDQYFDNTDISGTTGKDAKIDTPTQFNDQILKILNSGGTAYYTIKAGTISSNQDLTLPNLSGAGTLVAAGGANDWGEAAQTFRSTYLVMRNPANSNSYIFTTSAIAGNRVVTLPLLTGDDEFLMKSFAQTPTNKTLHIDTNTFKHSTTNAQGDILKYDSVSAKYIRLARGTADQVLAVNSGGTDIEWATVSAGSGGDADELKIYEGGVQVGSVARKLNFDTTDFDVTENAGSNLFTVTLAGAGASSDVLVYNRDLSNIDVVNTSSVTNIYSLVVTGNDLSTNKILEIDIGGDYLNNSGSSRTMDVTITFGSTVLWQATMGSYSASATRRAFNMNLFLANKNSASVQELWGTIRLSTPVAPTTGLGSGDDGESGFIHPISTSATSSENTATNKTFTVSVQHSSANSNLSLRKKTAIAKIM